MEQRNIYITPEQITIFCNLEIERYNQSENKEQLECVVKAIKSFESVNSNDTTKNNLSLKLVPILCMTFVVVSKDKANTNHLIDFFNRLKKFIIENGKEA